MKFVRDASADQNAFPQLATVSEMISFLSLHPSGWFLASDALDDA
jgi:hypothetical protein